MISAAAIEHIHRDTVWTTKVASLWKKTQMRCRLPKTADAVFNQSLFSNRFICDVTVESFPWQNPRGAYGWKWAEQEINKVGHLWDEERKDWHPDDEMEAILHGRMRRRQRVVELQEAIPPGWIEMLSAYAWKWAEQGIDKVGHLWDDERKDRHPDDKMEAMLHGRMKRRQRVVELREAIPPRWIAMRRKDEITPGEWVRMRGSTRPEGLYRVEHISAGGGLEAMEWQVTSDMKD
ncbi:hypothetical protein CBR_g25842 [Chara braunii]|nr:hypothetical protein CBR_g25842 [Chara braunii]|eukprot:GBG77911.1 hypothetical protein CBR_g25842 [Chara braunii]